MSGALLDPLSPAALPVSALLALRIGALVWIAPVLSARPVPPRFKAALVVLLTALLLPVAWTRSGPVAIHAASILTETTIGLALGLGAAVLVGAAETAGELISIQTGLSAASTLDPMTMSGTSSLGQFASLTAVAVLLATGGDHAMLGALADSVARLPVGGMPAMRDGLESLLGLGSTLFALGIRIAAPVVAAVLVGNVAVGVLARAAPQIGILSVAYGIQIAVGLVVLALALPVMMSVLSAWPEAYGAIADRTLQAFTPGRP